MTLRHLGRRIAVLVAIGGVVAACTGDDSPQSLPSDVSTTIPSTATTGSSTSSSSTLGAGPTTDAEFETWLLRKLSLPTLPSFAIPLDAFVDDRDVELADQLDVPAGLYEGIAVVDLRCSATSEVAADASGVLRQSDGSGTFRDGDVEIVVQGDGSGRYTTGATTIVIQSDGSGSYTSEAVQLEIQGDGSGIYHDETREIEVDSDRSGRYADGDIEVEVTANGASIYRDADRSIEVSAEGGVVEGADDPRSAVVARVLDGGLPLFPPVPRLGAVPEPVDGTSCGSVIRLDANVLFDFDADTLAPEAEGLLDRVGALLVALGSPALRVDGHTDALGSDEYNLDLSSRRAATVRRALAERGVSEESIATQGLGETQPLAPNETAEGIDDPVARQLNRRVELVLLDR